MEKSRILVVEDHPDTRRFLEAMLGKDFQILTAENGVLGIEAARKETPDLILMDIMLPVLNGYDACSLLKKDERTRRIPIIFLSAKNSMADVTQGLAQGTDDYIPKPFDFKELRSRIDARLRKIAPVDQEPVTFGELEMDPKIKSARIREQSAQLTTTEYDLLRCLASRAGQTVSRAEILKEVWRDEADETNDRTIDVHVRALRKKLPALIKHVTSVYGVGYRFEI